ncbi:YMGG-like glycine zipper-containing protein [Oecophyllibacter saccharovorans]|uniref:YMGG-like glycine zipper-containing protein n=1 Tax=Oecophyllibacter saccharovorans TaxID=2558360 RepID=UPI001883AA62|nr:YMGG-like glycine zipper-containing protein [Oecophyllibacter saccharovorans]
MRAVPPDEGRSMLTGLTSWTGWLWVTMTLKTRSDPGIFVPESPPCHDRAILVVFHSRECSGFQSLSGNDWENLSMTDLQNDVKNGLARLEAFQQVTPVQIRPGSALQRLCRSAALVSALALPLTFTLGACTDYQAHTHTGRTVSGGLLGAGAGAAIGALAGGGRGAAIGALSGAAVGATTGYLTTPNRNDPRR